jgi:hypothetical protein
MVDELLSHVAGELRHMTADTFAMTFPCKAARALLTSIASLDRSLVYLALLSRVERCFDVQRYHDWRSYSVFLWTIPFPLFVSHPEAYASLQHFSHVIRSVCIFGILLLCIAWWNLFGFQNTRSGALRSHKCKGVLKTWFLSKSQWEGKMTEGDRGRTV